MAFMHYLCCDQLTLSLQLPFHHGQCPLQYINQQCNLSVDLLLKVIFGSDHVVVSISYTDTIWWLCRHIKQKEKDVNVCLCQYDATDPDSACGERCLNVLTSTECTPGYCACDNYCKNQVFSSFTLRI